MANRKVQLKWMSYQEDMRDLFCKLREAEELTDIIVSNGSKNIKCHRIILSSACQIFYDLMKEHSGDLVIYLGSVHTSDMTSLVDFMYSGVVNVPQDRLSEFLALAKQWGVRGLGLDDASGKAQTPATKALKAAAAPAGSAQAEPPVRAAKRARPASSSDSSSSSSSEDEDGEDGAAARGRSVAGPSSAILSVVSTDAAQKGKKGVTNIPSRGEMETTVPEKQRKKKTTTASTPHRVSENLPDMFACPHCPRIFIKPHYFTTHKIKEHGDHTPINKHRVLIERGQPNSTGTEVLSGTVSLRLSKKRKKKRSDEEEKSREDESGRVNRGREREEAAREDREKERENSEKEREEAARENRKRAREEREREKEAARKAEQVKALAKKQAALAAAARAAADETSSDSSDSEPSAAASRSSGKSAFRAPEAVSRGRDRAPAPAAHGPRSSDTELPQRQTASGGRSEPARQETANLTGGHSGDVRVKEEVPLPADTGDRVVSYRSSAGDPAGPPPASSLSPHKRGSGAGQPGVGPERPSARVAPNRSRHDSPSCAQTQRSSQPGQRIVFDENGEPKRWAGSGEDSAEPYVDSMSRPQPSVHRRSGSQVREDDPMIFVDRCGQVGREGRRRGEGRPNRGRGRGSRDRASWRGHDPDTGRGGDWEPGRERASLPKNRRGGKTRYIWVRDEYKRFDYYDQGGGNGFWEQPGRASY